jgi:hypothetical protein
VLVFSESAQLAPPSVTFSTSNSGNGTISLSGTGTKLDVGGPMTFSNFGTSTLNVGSGSTIYVGGMLILGTSGTINLNGGTLTVGGFAANGGAVNWTGGTMAFTGLTTLGATELTALLGPGGTLSAGRTLKGSQFNASALSLTANLAVTGGTLTSTDIINTASLTISAGTVQGTTSISNPAGALLSVASGATLSGQLINGGEFQLGGGSARLTGALSNNGGRVSGTGTITGTLINDANSVVSADAGQRLVFGTGINESNTTI